jgi:hypothetical protein
MAPHLIQGIKNCFSPCSIKAHIPGWFHKIQISKKRTRKKSLKLDNCTSVLLLKAINVPNGM